MDEILYYCEYCNKPVYTNFASGRFCSRSCSCGWVAKNQSEEAKRRKVEKGIVNLEKGRVGTKASWTEERKKKHSELMSKYWTEEQRKKHSEIMLTKSDIIAAQMTGKRHSPETKDKISKAMKKAFEEGRHKGWGYTKHPYSEEYFHDFLTNENIEFIEQYSFSYYDENGAKRYFYFDFYLPEYNLDLEIDGDCHDKETQKARDQRRDEIVSKHMRIYRFRWTTPRTAKFTKRLEELRAFLAELASEHEHEIQTKE